MSARHVKFYSVFLQASSFSHFQTSLFAHVCWLYAILSFQKYIGNWPNSVHVVQLYSFNFIVIVESPDFTSITKKWFGNCIERRDQLGENKVGHNSNGH